MNTLKTFYPMFNENDVLNYKTDHWALQFISISEPRVIVQAVYKDKRYMVYLNPTDKRGYRCIVRLVSSSNMASTLNREYDLDEHHGLNLVVEAVEAAFRKFVPIVKSFKAGNNSHYFDLQTRTVQIGNSNEPSFLHMHIVGRGDPLKDYIPGIALDGSNPGLNFDMMAKTPTEPGNEKKIMWKSDQDMFKAAAFIRYLIDDNNSDILFIY